MISLFPLISLFLFHVVILESLMTYEASFRFYLVKGISWTVNDFSTCENDYVDMFFQVMCWTSKVKNVFNSPGSMYYF